MQDTTKPAFFRANLALAYAKALSNRKVYEEALETLKLFKPEQVGPSYTRTEHSVVHGLDAEQLHHYLDYCSEMLSLTAKAAALCAEHSTDEVVLQTISTVERLTTELSNKIWQKISLLPR